MQNHTLESLRERQGEEFAIPDMPELARQLWRIFRMQQQSPLDPATTDDARLVAILLQTALGNELEEFQAWSLGTWHMEDIHRFGALVHSIVRRPVEVELLIRTALEGRFETHESAFPKN